MTAFATQQGHADAGGNGASWTWDLRSVNGRGLDFKVRIPDGLDGVEALVRARAVAALSRGNVTAGLRLSKTQSEGALEIDESRLDTILEALDAVQERAFTKGVTLGQPTAADVLSQRGVLITGPAETAQGLGDQIVNDFETALSALIKMRETEGAALLNLLNEHITQIETLTAQAAEAAQQRTAATKDHLNAALARVMDDAATMDPDRVAQELALIAVKSDITEEIGRLAAHVQAARELLETGGPVGRKLDFLMQEFNREANTLCSKSQDVALTQIGLALKAVIDQMREQVQNVE